VRAAAERPAGDITPHGPGAYRGFTELDAETRLARRRRAPQRSGRRAAIAQFALSSLALLVVVAAIGAGALKHLATGEALSDAQSVTVAFSHGVLRREVTPAVMRGDPEALAALDRTVHETVLGHPIVRVKVWTPEGRIVYSDAHALIGRTFPLPHDLRGALADDAVRADVSDLARPENRLERGRGRLVEVYLPLRLATGRLVMVEAYHPAGRIDAASHRIWRTFLPMLLGLLLALAAAQLPLAWSQARRARADAREREELAREAERALQAERGRIATELHDGIVQDLAGAAYELHAAATLPNGASERDLRGALGRGAEVCRSTMTRMRELLVDLRTTEHRVQDLQGAIEAVARPLRDTGVEVIVGIAVERPLGGDTAMLVHRAVREILLDVRRRRDVTLVTLGLAERGAGVALTIDHNSIAGLRPARPDDDEAGRRPRLDSLAETLAAHGGSLVIDSRPGLGARYSVTLPAD
jgi:two-component system NarL family sensor kinase